MADSRMNVAAWVALVVVVLVIAACWCACGSEQQQPKNVTLRALRRSKVARRARRVRATKLMQQQQQEQQQPAPQTEYGVKPQSLVPDCSLPQMNAGLNYKAARHAHLHGHGRGAYMRAADEPKAVNGEEQIVEMLRSNMQGAIENAGQVETARAAVGSAEGAKELRGILQFVGQQGDDHTVEAEAVGLDHPDQH